MAKIKQEQERLRLDMDILFETVSLKIRKSIFKLSLTTPFVNQLTYSHNRKYRFLRLGNYFNNKIPLNIISYENSNEPRNPPSLPVAFYLRAQSAVNLQIETIFTSFLNSLAVSTIAFKAAFVSGQALVFKPQSGLIQSCLAGITFIAL